MYYLKFLGENHLESALREGAIRIGTINYYRKIEDKTRKDANEGLGEIIWKGQVLNAEDHNRVFTFTEKKKLADGWKIENKGMPLVGSKPNFNVYTFCLSQTNSIEKKDLERISKGKAESYYFITDYPKFVKKLTEKIKEKTLNFIRANKSDLKTEQIDKIELIDCSYRINYNDSTKARIVTEENVKTFNPTLLHTQDFFQKQTSFSNEQEVRIIWVFVIRDGKKIKPLSFPQAEVEYLDLVLGKLPISKTPSKSNYPIKISPLKNII